MYDAEIAWFSDECYVDGDRVLGDYDLCELVLCVEVPEY